MGDYTPVTTDQATVTLTAGAAITGGQLVEVSAAKTVIPCVGVNRPVGVASKDAVTGEPFTVYLLPGVIHETPIENTVVVVAGSPLAASTTAGRIKIGVLATIAGNGTLIGIALVGGTGNAGGTVLARWIGV
jgi:Uncharacterized conserved protein (DUF2190)